MIAAQPLNGHVIPILTARLLLRPPTIADLDPIRTAKEDASPNVQRWMAWRGSVS